VIKNGVPVALAGHTNVGKSTLLNALLGEERALVSDVHGTTRDTIEDTLQFNGITFRFIDTAGLRQTDETVEKLGIARTYEKIRNAAVVLLIADATRPETFAAIDDISHQLNDSQKLIVVVNKTDVCTVPPTLSSLTTHSLALTVVAISAKQKQGINKLTEALVHCVNFSPLANDKTIITNLRHYEALTKTLDSANRVEKGLKDQLSGECIAQDIRECMHHLGEITGEISTDEILGNIFSKFCIGK
jgi:tRNA modification GTPase